MTRLLTAEHGALGAHRGEHVAVADVGREHADTPLGHQAMEAEVRHLRHGDRLDTEGEREHGQDLIAVERRARLVDGEHPVAVAVECHAEVVVTRPHDLLQQRRDPWRRSRR